MTGKVWTKHYQIGWENRAANQQLPLWFRIVALAYGRHEANGHANFQRGHLSYIFGGPDASGTFEKRSRASLNSAINTAVTNNLLAEGSCTECLIVPAHDISGPLGDASKPCPVHERKERVKMRKQARMNERHLRAVE
jgi:hypothetical protein